MGTTDKRLQVNTTDRIRIYLVYVFPALLVLASSVGAAGAELIFWPCDCCPERVLSLTTPLLEGADISGLQSYLIHLGYDPGSIDGIYGYKTSTAVMEFQLDNRLESDGVVDSETWEALGRTAYTKGPPLISAESVEIIIDVHLARLMVWQHGEIIATYPVALGKSGTPTPIGNFHVVQKSRWGEGFGSRWLGLDVPWGVFGIHGTNRPWSVGGYESHGCIRLFNVDVEQLFEMVPLNATVHIIGDPFYGTSELYRGEKGAPVAYLQRRLRQLGFFDGAADGYFDRETERALISFQKSRGLEPSGSIGPKEIRALRLRFEDR